MMNFVVIFLVIIGYLALRIDGQATAPAPSTSGSLSTSANTTGSLGSYCSSQAGIQAAILADAGSQNSHVFNVTVPADLAPQIAQASPLPNHALPIPLKA